MYVIYQGEVLDPVRYDEYRTHAAASIHAAGGKYIVRGGDVEVLEGDAPAGRTVVLKFPTGPPGRDRLVSQRGLYGGSQDPRGAARACMYVVDGYDDVV